MLIQNPQLAYALLQAQVIMKIVDPKVADVSVIGVVSLPSIDITNKSKICMGKSYTVCNSLMTIFMIISKIYIKGRHLL